MKGFAGGFAVAPCTPSQPLRKQLEFNCKEKFLSLQYPQPFLYGDRRRSPEGEGLRPV